ncbi:hypothetical protein CHARACLAT_031749 [Characodon lateralis]|uniref:Uncharacterized protein n=1 Tax=Characodon lateralis TaxID=208331 RepID=A0ABU7E5V1_9TELE|nr:hypothetical protein [Characodon lateralis]
MSPCVTDSDVFAEIVSLFLSSAHCSVYSVVHGVGDEEDYRCSFHSASCRFLSPPKHCSLHADWTSAPTPPDGLLFVVSCGVSVVSFLCSCSACQYDHVTNFLKLR